jgi:hypothetical protein
MSNDECLMNDEARMTNGRRQRRGLSDVRSSLDTRRSVVSGASRRRVFLAILLLLFTSGGCPWMWSRPGEVLQPTLPATATLDQIIAAVNDNTARIHSISAMQASISLPGVPTVPVSLALEPPLRFRLRASTALTGTEVDLGSNEELFWIWVRRNQPPAVYYCRHDQFANSAARQIMPVEPEWIVEALGLVHFDPADQPQGPTPVGAGRVQIKTVRHSSIGDLTKITVVDPARAIVLEQDLYDGSGHLVAAARTSDHRHDPVTGVILPRHIEIDYPSAQLTMKIDIKDLQVNTLGPQNAQLWTKPEYSGYQNVNLADQNLTAQPSGFAAPSGSAALPVAPGGIPPSALPAFAAPSAGAQYLPPAAAPNSTYGSPVDGAPATPSAYRSARLTPYP